MSYAESTSVPGDDQPPALRAIGHSRAGIWLPATLTCLLLLLIGAVSVMFGRRIQAHSEVVSELLEPARDRLEELKFSFGMQVAAIRSFALSAREEPAARYRTAFQREADLIDELDIAARRLGPEFDQEFTNLRAALDRWHVDATALIEGRLTRSEFIQRLPQHEVIAMDIVARYLRMGNAIERYADTRIAAIEDLERRRLFLLAGLSVLALLSAALSVWFGERARKLWLRHQRLAAALEEKRHLLGAVVEQMPAGVSIVEAPTGKLIHSNRESVEIFGGEYRPAEDIQDYTQIAGFHLDGRRYGPEEWPIARSVQRGETVEGEEIEIVRFDGTRAVVRVSSVPIRDATGRIVAGVATLHDITDQKRREEGTRFLDEASRILASSLDYEATLGAALRLSVPRLADFAVAHLLENGGRNVGVGRVEPASTDSARRDVIRRLNRRYKIDLDGPHPSAIAIRTGKSQFIPEVTDDMLQRLTGEDAESLRLMRMLGVRAVIAAPLTVGGKTIGALFLASMDPARRYTPEDLALTEELARRAAVAIDNAELFRAVAEAEKRATFLAEAAQTLSGSIEYDETLRRAAHLAVPFLADCVVAYLLAGPDDLRQVAAAHRDEKKQALLEEFGRHHRPDPANPRSVAWQTVHSGQPVLLESMPPDFEDALGFGPRAREIYEQFRPKSLVAAPLVARDTTMGAIVFISAESGRCYTEDDLWLARQLASRAALAVQNAKLYSEIEDALQTRDEVLSIVSHDLRNPLSTIAMSIELMLQVRMDEAKLRKQLEVIRAAEQRMNRLIQDLLDVARIEAGKTIAIEPRSESVVEIVREACESALGLARDNNVTLEWEVPENLPPVCADRGRILQVLSNLVGNAVKFTQPGGHIDVDAAAVNGVVSVSVRDNGPGIAAEDIDRIFAPFWQAPRALRKGAGLGLAISQAIVQQHGGDIHVESEPGQGATFTFTLPVAQGEDERAAAD